jgi:hypothetical protein
LGLRIQPLYERNAGETGWFGPTVTAFKDGLIPERLQSKEQKDRALAQLIVVTPKQIERKMAFVNAEIGLKRQKVGVRDSPVKPENIQKKALAKA